MGERLILAAILAGAAALRFVAIGEQSFWYDEAVTVTVIDRPFGDMLGRLPDSESTPPLYYVLAWLWTQVTGVGEVGLRSLSAVAGVATVAAVYAVGRGRAGLVAAALVAANPMLVWYSQEARAYSLVALLAALTLLALVRARAAPTAGRLAVWGVVSALLIATHYFGVFLVIPEALVLLGAAERRRAVAVACLPWLATGLALVPLARAQEADGRTSWIADEPLGERTLDLGRELLTANTEIVSTSSSAPGGVYFVPVVLALLVAAALIVRARPGTGGTAVIGLAALAVPLALALTPLDFFKDRNLIAAWPVLAVALGAALAAAATPSVVAGLAAAVAGAGAAVCVAVAGDPDLQREDWRAAIERVGRDDVPRAIVLQPAYAGAPAAVYGLDLSPPAVGAGVRELVVLGTSTDPANAPPESSGFRVVERADRGMVGFVRYRADGLRRLDASALALAGPGLRLQLTAAARDWARQVAALGTEWAALAGRPPARVSPDEQADAPARVAALLPVPEELPEPDALRERLTEAAAAAAAYGAQRDATTQQRLISALTSLTGESPVTATAR